MRLPSLLVLLLLGGCARNSDRDTADARIRDTVLTAADTVTPNDTLDHARRAVPDTVGGLDTTSRQ